MGELKAPEGYSLGAVATVDQLEPGQHFLSRSGQHWQFLKSGCRESKRTSTVEPTGAYWCQQVDVVGEGDCFAGCADATLLVPFIPSTPPAQALHLIQELLDGIEWDGFDALKDIAQILKDAGYQVRDVDDMEGHQSAPCGLML